MISPDLLEWRASGKKPRAHAEEDLQCAIVQHLKLWGRSDVIWYHPANGGARSKRAGARMKMMGVVPGIPDLAFVLSDGRAAYIELKAAGGRLEAPQRAFQAKCEAMHVEYAVCHSLDSALAILRAWGVLPDY